MRTFFILSSLSLIAAAPNYGYSNPNPETTNFQLPYDSIVNLESSNYPGYTLGIKDGRILIQNEVKYGWKVVNPLVGVENCKCKAGESCISLQSAASPNRYARHRNYELWLDDRDESDLYKNDASFCVASGNNKKPGYFSFRSVNYPENFIRHCNWVTFIDNPTQRNPPLFDEDSSFSFNSVEGGSESTNFQLPYDSIVNLESSNYPGYTLGIKDGRILIQNQEKYEWKVVNPLVGAENCKCKSGESCISLQSAASPNRYARHRNYELWLDDRDESDLYKNDASFCVVSGNNNKPGYFSFRSVNYPSNFIRHYGYNAYIDTAGQRNPQLFNEDTSFRFNKVEKGGYGY